MAVASDTHCNAETKGSKTPCQRGAGWGTNHPGAGRCKLHGGSSPNGEQNGAVILAKQYMAADQPQEAISPIDALLYCVQRASQRATYCRVALAAQTSTLGTEYTADGKLHPWAAAEGKELEQLARFSKAALDAGVAERQVRIAERMGAAITQAFETALAGLDLSDAQRSRAVSVFSGSLSALESGEVIEV